MLDSFLSDFSEIRDTLGKEGDHQFFGKNFSFFSAEPILFYNNEKDVIVYANSMFNSEFNYTINDLEDWKYSIYPLLNSEDQILFKNAMKALLDGDENTTFPDASYRLINKDKKYSYYRVKIRKLHKSYYYIQLENSLKSAIPVLNNKTADDLMNNAEAILKFGFWMWDLFSDKLYWTKGMYSLMECEKDELEDGINAAFYKSHILKNDNYLDFEKRLQDGKIKDSYRIKYQIKTIKDNLATFFEHANIEYNEEGKAKYITGITRDITLQEESMKSLADYKSMILENEAFLNYGTWESEPDGKEINWSEGMYKIFGYNEEDKKNLTINKKLYSKHMSPKDFISGLKNINGQLKDNDIYKWNYEIKDNQGVQKIISTYGKIIRRNDDQILKIIGTTCDVTELRVYEKMLEHKIAALNRSNLELEEFAYVASHDLQEPLRKISTFSQRLQIKYSDKLGEDGNLYINRMVNACDNMRKLIDNLIEFSRISLNNPPPQLVDLTVIVNEATANLDLLILESGTTVTINPLPSVEAIGSQMLQLFVNIISNSIKFRKENTPLKIEISSGILNLTEKELYQLPIEIEYYCISIKDNGIGFEQQYADRIFQLFQRLEGKSEYPGTGIGLSICKKIISNHNGHIFAEGESQKGATFSIILPKYQ